MTRFGAIRATEAPAAAGTWPSGAIIALGVAGTPEGFLPCDGSVVSQVTYAALFAVVGHKYGADPGGGNFRLPNLVDKVPVGPSAGKALGARGGAIAHKHAIGSVAASHYHTDGSLYAPSHNHGHNFGIGGHTHGTTESVKVCIAGSEGFYNRAFGGATQDVYYGYGGGIGGGLYAVGNLDVYGNTDWQNPAPTGETGSADPPYVAVGFAVKT